MEAAGVDKCAPLLAPPNIDWRKLIGQKRQKSQGVAHREGRTRSLQIAPVVRV